MSGQTRELARHNIQMMETNSSAMAFVIMGVSGSGKSTVGQLLAKEMDCRFIDADDFHSEENKEKMRRGIPLTNDDRIPWLEALRDALIDHIIRGKSVVLACSALQPLYRDILREADYARFQNKQQGKLKGENKGLPQSQQRVEFFLLNGPIDLFASRLEKRFKRGDHFMPPSLLQSQMDALQIGKDEAVFFLDASKSPNAIVDEIKELVSS